MAIRSVTSLLFHFLVFVPTRVSHAWSLGSYLLKQKNAATATPPEEVERLLNLTVHESLLTQDECQAILKVAQPFLKESKVGRPPRVQPSLRISLSCKLPRLPVPQLWSAEQKLATAAGLPVQRGEDLQVGGYPVGNYYGMHCDERKGGRANGGGRLATALAYLNDLDPTKVTGGHTVFSGARFDLDGEPDFPRGDKRVRQLKQLCSSCDVESDDPADEEEKALHMVAPKQGRVITFRNLAPVTDGKGDVAGGKWRFLPESTHGACPIVSVTDPPATGEGAEKFIVQQWFGLDSESNVARHPRMISHIGLGVANNYDIDPMADLGSPTGEPFATTTTEEASTTNVDSLIPRLGATKLEGPSAQLEAQGQPGAVQSLDQGISAALWINRQRPTNSAELQRIFRVGPHELLMETRTGKVAWAVGDTVARFPASIPIGQWRHVAVTISPPIFESNTNGDDGLATFKANLYVSVPGRNPDKPVWTKLTGMEVPEWKEGISIGGNFQDQDGDVDMTVFDFYAIAQEIPGKGPEFAYAAVYYDPEQGL